MNSFKVRYRMDRPVHVPRQQKRDIRYAMRLRTSSRDTLRTCESQSYRGVVAAKWVSGRDRCPEELDFHQTHMMSSRQQQAVGASVKRVQAVTSEKDDQPRRKRLSAKTHHNIRGCRLHMGRSSRVFEFKRSDEDEASARWKLERMCQLIWPTHLSEKERKGRAVCRAVRQVRVLRLRG